MKNIICPECQNILYDSGKCTKCSYSAPRELTDEEKRIKAQNKRSHIGLFVVSALSLILSIITAGFLLILAFKDNGFFEAASDAGGNVAFFGGLLGFLSLVYVIVPIIYLYYIILTASGGGATAYGLGKVITYVSIIISVITLLISLAALSADATMNTGGMSFSYGNVADMLFGEERGLVYYLATLLIFMIVLSVLSILKMSKLLPLQGGLFSITGEQQKYIAETARNAAGIAAAEAKTIVKAGLPYLKEFVKRPSGVIRDYCMGLKECLTIAVLQAFGAAFAALVVVGKSSLWSSLLSFFSYRRANLFFGVFFVCLLGAAVFCGFLLLFGKIFRGGITGENAKARLLSSAAAAQIPMTAAFLLSIIMGFIYSPLIIALVVFGLMAGVALTVIIYREVFGLTEDNAMYASVTAWTAQVVAILLILSN